jgi:DUF971 family protein
MSWMAGSKPGHDVLRDRASVATNDPWPTEIRLKDKGRTLAVSFDGGDAFDLTAEYLRVMSPSAEVQGHSAAERKTVGGKQNVAIIQVEPVGNYAVRLVFDDMHSTGIYSWRYLHELGTGHATRWAEYLGELEAKGLSRARAGVA